MGKLDKQGREILDLTPVSIPVAYTRPLSLQEQIKRMVRSEEFMRQADAAGVETFDEADDFDVGDDFDPSSPYELEFDPDLGREVSKEEKRVLDEARREFDDQLKKKQAAGRKPKSKVQDLDAAKPRKKRVKQLEMDVDPEDED